MKREVEAETDGGAEWRERRIPSLEEQNSPAGWTSHRGPRVCISQDLFLLFLEWWGMGSQDKGYFNLKFYAKPFICGCSYIHNLHQISESCAILIKLP